MEANWLSNVVMTRSRFEPFARGSSAPSISFGASSPAIAQNVGARSTRPTGSSITAGAMPEEGAGRHTSGTCIKAST